MKVSATRLSTEGFDLELPNEDGESDRVQLARGTIVRGTFSMTSDDIHLDDIAAEELEGTLLRFFVGERGKIEAMPLGLRGAEVDCRIARGPLRGRTRFGGTITAAELAGRSFTVDLGQQQVRASTVAASALAFAQSRAEGTVTRAASFVASGLDVLLAGRELGDDTRVAADALETATVVFHREPLGTVRVELGSVDARGGRVTIGTSQIVFASLTAKNVVFASGPTGSSLSASAVTARGVELSLGATSIHLGDLELPRGVRYGGAKLVIERAALSEGTFTVSNLGKSKSDAPARPSSSTIDWRILDGLNGRLHVDVTVDAKVPIIKRRVATHKLRIAIDNGIIDFHELERDLSLLEDAILDFEFQGDRLILEKDLPLIPFDNETLVFWMLDEEGKRLAADRRVRLHTLAAPKFPSKPASDKKPSFELLRLDLDPIDAELHLHGLGRFAIPGGATLRVGSDQRAGIGQLRVKGAVRHRPADIAEGSHTAEAGQLELQGTDLCLGLFDLHAGGRTTSCEEVVLDALQNVKVTMDGAAPTHVEGTVRGLLITGLVVGLPEKSP